MTAREQIQHLAETFAPIPRANKQKPLKRWKREFAKRLHAHGFRYATIAWLLDTTEDTIGHWIRNA